MNAYMSDLTTVGRINTKLKYPGMLERSLEGKYANLRSARIHFGAIISMKIGLNDNTRGVSLKHFPLRGPQ